MSLQLLLQLLVAICNLNCVQALQFDRNVNYKYSNKLFRGNFLAMSDKVEKRIENIEKSIGDSRLYRGLVLKNGLTALLISDPDTDKSAASLSVAVGKK